MTNYIFLETVIIKDPLSLALKGTFVVQNQKKKIATVYENSMNYLGLQQSASFWLTGH